MSIWVVLRSDVISDLEIESYDTTIVKMFSNKIHAEDWVASQKKTKFVQYDIQEWEVE